MAVTLKDISRETGINLCSVSQVLNDHPRAQSLRPETRKRILETALRLGYRKNQMAASIGKKFSNVLAFVHSDMGTVEYTGRIQSGVIEAASRRGYTLTVHHIGDSPENLIRKLMGWRIAGVIFHVSKLEQLEPFTAELEREKIPYGTVNLSNPDGVGVTTDDAAGIEEAVRYLQESGHKKIVYAFSGKDKTIPDIEYKTRRIEGFRKGIAAYYSEGTKPFLLPIDYSKSHNREYMTKILKKILQEKADGVICESDVLASALNNIAFFKGYSIPEVFSLIGFGGSMISETSFPMLTTIAQDFEKMGKLATDSIVDAAEKKNIRNIQNQLIPVSLVLRESVKIQKEQK